MFHYTCKTSIHWQKNQSTKYIFYNTNLVKIVGGFHNTLFLALGTMDIKVEIRVLKLDIAEDNSGVVHPEETKSQPVQVEPKVKDKEIAVPTDAEA